MLKLIWISALILSFNSFAKEESIGVTIKLVKVIDDENREFGEEVKYKVIETYKSALEKVVEKDKTEYYINVPKLGTKYLVGVRESVRYFKEGILGGKSTPLLHMKMKGHQLKRLMDGIESRLNIQKGNTELTTIMNTCFDKDDCGKGLYASYHGSCSISTQPAISPGSYYPSYEYEFQFVRQQGLFFYKDRKDSFNFMKNRILFSVYNEKKTERYELHIDLDDAAF